MTAQSEKSTFPAAPPAIPGAAHDAAKTVLAAGELLAALGVASCCALPLALSLLGISAASLVGVGYMAARYQHELFYAAVICLVVTAVTMWRQWRARSCLPVAACARPALNWASKIAFTVALGFLALTFWIEPPL
jgi:mercuric ion transport protein